VPIINLSTRGQVSAGSSMIGGFVVSGSGSQTVVIRGLGPSLSGAGIANPLPNPVLQIVRMSDRAIIATNDNWTAGADAAQISAKGFAPSSGAEAAVLVTLPPGAYGALLSDASGGSGIGIVEIYTAN